jgi:hypothetical protein
MISLDLGHFIAKFYLVGYFICFLISYSNKDNNKSNLIIVTYALVFCLFNQYIKSVLDFYTYYLGCAFSCLVCLVFSLITHLIMKIKHAKTTIYVYVIHLLIALSYLVIHRVRVVLFDSDEHILWLINSQSGFTLSLYFFSICVLFYGSKILWKSQFGRLSSLF